MQRSAELAGLSRDHHVALGVALALRRADADHVAEAVARFLAFFVVDGERHFGDEERVLLCSLPETMARRLVDEHAEIRLRAQALGADAQPAAARALGERLAGHVRFEEREVFPLLEARLSPERLAELGAQLEHARQGIPATSMRHPAS